MSKFFVGQRVKKVRGEDDVGLTGVIVDLDPGCVLGHTLLIRGDRPMRVRGGLFREDRGTMLEAWGRPEHWEPIINLGLEACDEDFKLSLDELLERQREAA